LPPRSQVLKLYFLGADPASGKLDLDNVFCFSGEDSKLGR
jgi:hypothetical protein